MFKTMGTAVAALCLLGVCSSARASDVSLSAIVQAHNLSVPEAAAAVLIADALGLDATIVIQTGKRSGAPLIEMGPAFVLGRECRCSADKVWKLRRSGLGWGQVAHKLGMHPGTFNKMRVKGDFDQWAWNDMMRRSYRLQPADLVVFQRNGMRRGDVIAAVVVSKGDKRRFDEAVGSWKSDKSWKSAMKGKSDEVHGQGNSKSPGKGKGHGNGGSQGQGKGHGKGHGGG